MVNSDKNIKELEDGKTAEFELDDDDDNVCYFCLQKLTTIKIYLGSDVVQ